MQHRLRTALAVLPALTLTATLAACGGEEAEETTRPVPLSGRQTTADGAASLVLPQGWVKAPEALDGPVTFAAVDALDETHEVFVTTAKSIDDAEDAAFYAATALTGQKATCHRDRTDDTFGGTYRIVDCAWTEPSPYRKVMVALGDEKHGAMILVAGAAKTRKDLAGLLTPILASWQWRK